MKTDLCSTDAPLHRGRMLSDCDVAVEAMIAQVNELGLYRPFAGVHDESAWNVPSAPSRPRDGRRRHHYRLERTVHPTAHVHASRPHSSRRQLVPFFGQSPFWTNRQKCQPPIQVDTFGDLSKMEIVQKKGGLVADGCPFPMCVRSSEPIRTDTHPLGAWRSMLVSTLDPVSGGHRFRRHPCSDQKIARFRTHDLRNNFSICEY